MVEKPFMPVTAIHPGEHLAGELNALDMSAAESRAKDSRANQPRDANPERHSLDHRRHGSAPRPLLWHPGAELSDPSAPLTTG